ncbi:hypothetical protein [Desulfurivibrio dismutans]|uniref:hypothetical protein n=1 Tax=Desulfurivibrio dismutans TaxID=1398908 RepID=UPI0023DC9973|nr:hypothetical protein [Desulfurivibrio alkaliphilus]MDF1615733.1 hypothetical protein [Desulfurivibrio alkaliphilus]
MNVNGITGNNPLPLALLGTRPGMPWNPPTAQETAPESGTEAAPTTGQAPVGDIVNPTPPAVDINFQQLEVLRRIAFPSPPAPSSLPPTLANLLEGRELEPPVQREQILSQALLTLGARPEAAQHPFLLPDIPTTLEFIGFEGELPAAAQSALRISAMLQTLAPPTPMPPASPPPPAITPVAASSPPAEQVDRAVPPAAVTEPPAREAVPPTGPPHATAVAPSPAPTPAEPVTLTAAFLPPDLTPATLPVSRFPDRTPYVLVVIQPHDPSTFPSKPAPMERQVTPVRPIAASRPIGDAFSRQLLSRGKSARQDKVEYGTATTTLAQAEKSIRHTLALANEDISTQGLPLHLVFTRSPGGPGVDVYDCSDYQICRVSYHAPISLENLTETLDHLQHETGIIVNRRS